MNDFDEFQTCPGCGKPLVITGADGAPVYGECPSCLGIDTAPVVVCTVLKRLYVIADTGSSPAAHGRADR